MCRVSGLVLLIFDLLHQLWEEILTQERKFDRSYREANVLLRISKKHLIEFAEKIFVPPEKLEKNAAAAVRIEMTSPSQR